MTQHDDSVYLRHMLSHAREALEIYRSTTPATLQESRVYQLALLHLIEIVGETASRISHETKSQLDMLPWRGMVTMRNRIIHGYDTINIRILWDTIETDLPKLVATLENLVDKK